MLFNGRALIFTFSGTQVRIAEHERLQSLFKTSMVKTHSWNGTNLSQSPRIARSLAVVRQRLPGADSLKRWFANLRNRREMGAIATGVARIRELASARIRAPTV